MESPVVGVVLEQHADDAAFLALLRQGAIREPHYSLTDLTKLDDRLAASIDGLAVAGETGWDICETNMATEEFGEVFSSAVLALEAFDGQKLDTVSAIAQRSETAWRGLAAAFGWIPEDVADNWIGSMSAANRVEYQLLCVSGCAVHRRDPGQALAEAINSHVEIVCVRALRAVGELKRRDLLPTVLSRLHHENTSTRFWASWAAALLGRESGLASLKSFVGPDLHTDFAQRALQLGLRAMPLAGGRTWLRQLFENSRHRRNVLAGCGTIGDPFYVPWLIAQMETPEYARVAGESFSMITGVDLAYDDLDTDWPEGFEAGPTEDPADENVEMDQDEDLPWPDPEKLGDWWAKHKSQYQTGVRYLCGKPISIEQCQHVLRYGFQRQRIAAALELALLQPDEPLFETRAPGFRQQELLGLKRR